MELLCLLEDVSSPPVQYCVRAALAAADHPVGPRLIRRTLHNEPKSSSLCRKRTGQARAGGSDKHTGQPSFNLPACGSDPLELHNQTAPLITLQSTYCAKRDGWRCGIHPTSEAKNVIVDGIL
jgi:hypothetical protein